MSQNKRSSESTPFLSQNNNNTNYQNSTASSPTSFIPSSTSDSPYHEIYTVGLYSRLGPCLENNYNATPTTSPIITHGLSRSEFSPNFTSQTFDFLQKLSLQVVDKQRENLNQFNNNGVIIKASYQHSSYNVHVLEQHFNDRFYFYVTISHSQVPLRVGFGLLERVKTDVRVLLVKSGSAGGVLDQKAVNSILKNQLQFCSSKTNDKLVLVQAQIEDVKNIMISNIDKIVKNMESTQVLAQRTDDLNYDSQTFVYQARKTSNKMLCRILIILGVVAFIVIAIIVFVVLMIKYA